MPEKICPFIQEGCIKDRCVMWLQISARDAETDGKIYLKELPEFCAVVSAGAYALTKMSFPKGH